MKTREAEKKEVLDEFGKLLISEVRDKAILNVERVIRGQMKGNPGAEVGMLCDKLSEQEKCSLIKFGAITVLDALSNFFYLLEWKQDVLKLTMEKNEVNYDLTQISDGLVGEILTNGGWISRFSQCIFDEENYLY